LSNDEIQYDIFQIKNKYSLLTKLDNLLKYNKIVKSGIPTSFKNDYEKTLYVVLGLTNDSNNRDLFFRIYSWKVCP